MDAAQVPASQVALEGSTLKGMAFTLYGGHATWDAAGRLSSATKSTSVPTLTVNASTANASRLSSTPGVITLTRAGAPTNDLAVTFTLSGSAVNGVDYQPSTGTSSSIVLLAGATSTNLTIVPLATTNFVPGRTVVLTLASNATYAVGAPNQASVVVEGNTIKPGNFSLSSTGVSMGWASTANGVYRIAYKNSLSDPNWTTAGPDITATGATTSWVDRTTPRPNQRFYLVGQVR